MGEGGGEWGRVGMVGDVGASWEEWGRVGEGWGWWGIVGDGGEGFGKVEEGGEGKEGGGGWGRVSGW